MNWEVSLKAIFKFVIYHNKFGDVVRSSSWNGFALYFKFIVQLMHSMCFSVCTFELQFATLWGSCTNRDLH